MVGHDNGRQERRVAGALSEKLIPRLLERFPDRGLRIHDGTQPAVTFPAAHPDVGDLTIDDDDVELTISVGHLTHGHFSSWDQNAPQHDREEEVIAHVLSFLDAVFADEMVFWSADKAGGWHGRGDEPIVRHLGTRRFTWSGPLDGY
jgi:hypothetical protein